VDFSTLFHSRTKPQDSLFTLLALSIEGSFEGFTLLALSFEGSFYGPTLSSSTPCQAINRTSPPHSNN
jgi:hypothetical protein